MQASSQYVFLVIGIIIGIGLTVMIIRSSNANQRRDRGSYSSSRKRNTRNDYYPKGDKRGLWTFAFVMGLLVLFLFYSKSPSEDVAAGELLPVPSEQKPVGQEGEEKPEETTASAAQQQSLDVEVKSGSEVPSHKVLVKQTIEGKKDQTTTIVPQPAKNEAAIDPPAFFEEEKIHYNSSPKSAGKESFFYIQVDASSKEVKIFKKADAWRDDSPFKVHIGYGADQTLPYKLLIGPYRTRDMAKKQIKKVKKKGAFVRNIQEDRIQLIDRSD